MLRVPGLELGLSLLLASRNGQTDAVHALLEANAAVDRVGVYMGVGGAMSLYLASEEGHAGCVTALLEADAAVDRWDVNGPLHLAFRNGHHCGCTPLRTATDLGHTAVAHILRRAGAQE